MLDLFEFGVSNFKSMAEFHISEVSKDLKPILLFQGEQFEFSEIHMRVKNLFYGKFTALNIFRFLPLNRLRRNKHH
jgi:hypothetical protein